MSRDAVTPVSLAWNTGTSKGAGTAINTTNGAYIDVTDIAAEKLLIEVTNTNGSNRVVTVSAGDFYGKPGANLEVTVTATTGDFIFCLETAKYKQNDSTNLGYILLDFATSMTGYVYAYILP